MSKLLNRIAPLDDVIPARVRVMVNTLPDDAPFYSFRVDYDTTFDAGADIRFFDTRAERQAAILLLCDDAERLGYKLTVS